MERWEKDIRENLSQGKPPVWIREKEGKIVTTPVTTDDIEEFIASLRAKMSFNKSDLNKLDKPSTTED